MSKQIEAAAKAAFEAEKWAKIAEAAFSALPAQGYSLEQVEDAFRAIYPKHNPVSYAINFEHIHRELRQRLTQSAQPCDCWRRLGVHDENCQAASINTAKPAQPQQPEPERKSVIRTSEHERLVAEAEQKAKQEAYEEVAVWLIESNKQYEDSDADSYASDIRAHFCKPKELEMCSYCRGEIKEDERSVSGWRHVSGSVQCLVNAKPSKKPEAARLSKEGNRD